MTQTLGRVGTLLLAVAILLIGHGLQLSLLPMRAEALGWTTSAIGFTGSAYFLGFVAGCLLIPPIVSQVGHVRTFMVMAAVAVIALLGLGLLDRVWIWLVLRCSTGFAFAGLYMVIESWLNEAAPVERRGGVLAVYSMISLLAMMAGQGFLGFAPAHDLRLVMGSALIMAIAIVPIGLTRMAAPQPIPRVRFNPGVLTRASRVAVVCALFGGLVTGSFWSVGPLVGRALGLDGAGIGVMMAVAITGGALGQFPAGRLSDHTDRRFVIAGLFTLATMVCALGWRFAADSTMALYLVMGVLGATTMPIYALCVVTASDNTDAPLIQVASGILIVNSLGSVIGPMLVSPIVGSLGGEGFFAFSVAALTAGAAWAYYRIFTVERPHAHEHPFVAVPRTSMVATELVEQPPEPVAEDAIGNGVEAPPDPAAGDEPGGPAATERASGHAGSAGG